MKATKILMALFIAGAISSCGNREENPEQTNTQNAVVTATNTTDKYVCPMNCEGSGSDQPGKCPVCGMDLVLNRNYQESGTADSASVMPDTASSENHNHDDHDHGDHDHEH
jgi:hypothetical protein